MMKAAQIREMKPEDRNAELEKLVKELFNLRTRSQTEKLENTHLLRNIKRDIARCKTIIRQSQLKA
jgi:large subunit ribosomal protein L29